MAKVSGNLMVNARVLDVISKQVLLNGFTDFISTVIGPKLDKLS